MEPRGRCMESWGGRIEVKEVCGGGAQGLTGEDFEGRQVVRHARREGPVPSLGREGPGRRESARERRSESVATGMRRGGPGSPGSRTRRVGAFRGPLVISRPPRGPVTTSHRSFLGSQVASGPNEGIHL